MMKHMTATISMTLCALLWLVSPALAQLTHIEEVCRTNGQFAYDMALSRDKGYSVTDNLLHVRQWAFRNGTAPERLAYFERVVRVVYEFPDAPALEHRKVQEIACIKVLENIQQQASAIQRLDELEAELARRDAQTAKQTAPRKRSQQGPTLTKDPNRY